MDNSWEKSTTDVLVTLALIPRAEKLEAVILPPSDYEEWLPKGGPSEVTLGNGLAITTRLQVENDPLEFPMEKVRFRYELVDTSRERGVCLNSPELDLAAVMSSSLAEPEHDLKISARHNPHLEVSDGQTAITKKESINPQFSQVIVAELIVSRMKKTLMVPLINLITEYLLPCGINDSAKVVLRIAPLGSFSQGCRLKEGRANRLKGFVDVHIKAVR